MTREALPTMQRPGYFADVSTLSVNLIAGLTNALVYLLRGIAYALVRSTSL